MRRWLVFSVLLLVACSTPATADDPAAGLRSDDPEVAREAVREWVARGGAAIRELRQLVDDADERVAARARAALAQVTGQWGSNGRLIWHRSVEDAVGAHMFQKKPLLVLQLFGKFDEEFC